MRDKVIEFLPLIKAAGFNPMSILDIGAHNGSFTLSMSEIWPDAKIMMIEANKEHEESLRQICSNNNKLSYKIALVGKDASSRKFYKTKIDNNYSSTGNSMYKENTEYYSKDNTIVEIIKSVRLDDLCDKGFDLVKIDVQGAELEVLMGGESTIKVAKAIICEVSSGEYNQGSPHSDTVRSMLANYGFKDVKIIDRIYHSGKEIQQNILFLNKNICPLAN